MSSAALQNPHLSSGIFSLNLILLKTAGIDFTSRFRGGWETSGGFTTKPLRPVGVGSCTKGEEIRWAASLENVAAWSLTLCWERATEPSNLRRPFTCGLTFSEEPHSHTRATESQLTANEGDENRERASFISAGLLSCSVFEASLKRGQRAQRKIFI